MLYQTIDTILPDTVYR